MSLWDEISEAVDDYSLNDLKNGAGAIFNAYTNAEAQKTSSHAAARADQAAALYVPEVDSQSKGDPVSVKLVKEQRELVGDVSEGETVVNKKWFYAGGAVLAVALIVGIIAVVKK